MTGGRQLESWEACIHYGVLNSSTDRYDQRLDKPYAGMVLLHHYNDGQNGGGNLKRSVTRFSMRLEDSDDSITKGLITLYKKHEHFWADKAQDMVHEYEEEALKWEPRRIEGR